MLVVITIMERSGVREDLVRDVPPWDPGALYCEVGWSVGLFTALTKKLAPFDMLKWFAASTNQLPYSAYQSTRVDETGTLNNDSTLALLLS